MIARFATPTVLAGTLAVAIGAIDALVFHGILGLELDKGLILGGISFIAGVAVPSPVLPPGSPRP